MKGKTITDDELYEFNKNLSFPRRNDGTEGHQKAIDYIETELKKLDVDFEEEDFTWRDLRKKRKYTRTIPMLLFSIRILIGAVMMFFHDPTIVSGNILYRIFLEPGWIMLICAVLLLIWVVVVYSDCVMPNVNELNRINDGNLKKSEKMWEFNDGKNIVVRFGRDGTTSKAKKENIPIFVIVAHYDSISTKFRPGIQNMLAGTMITLPVSAIIAQILLPFTMNYQQTKWYMLTLMACLVFFSLFSVFALILRLFNKLSNESAGAFDNATGCSTLYGLINNLKNYEINHRINADIRLVFADCEEEGLMGTIEYFHRHQDEFLDPENKDRVKMVSLDGTGGNPTVGLFSSYGMPRVIRCDRGLKEEFQELGEKILGYKMRSLWSPYASSDHAVFGEFGIKAIQLFSMGMVSNTKYDTLDYVHPETLGLTTKLITEFVLKNVQS